MVGGLARIMKQVLLQLLLSHFRWGKREKSHHSKQDNLQSHDSIRDGFPGYSWVRTRNQNQKGNSREYRAILLSENSDLANGAIKDILLPNSDKISFDVLTGAWWVPASVFDTLKIQYKGTDITKESDDESNRTEGSRIFLKDAEQAEAFIIDYDRGSIWHFTAGDLKPIPHPGFVSVCISQSNNAHWLSSKEIFPSLNAAVRAFTKEALAASA